jgi:hypothetical protein
LAKREALSDSGLSQDEQEEIDGCWICFPDLNLAKKPAKVKGTHVQGERRAQLNHRGHSHAATIKARRASKELFRAKVGELTKETTPEVLAKFSAGWDAVIGNDGKAVQRLPEAPKKATKMTVTPLGPKGGVLRKLKEGRPA